jgi:hypothetical protein
MPITPPGYDISTEDLVDYIGAYVDAQVAAAGGLAATDLPRAPASPPVVPGRAFSTNFASAAQTAAEGFDVAAMTFTTDSGDSSRPSVRPTTQGTEGTVFLKSAVGWMRNMRVDLRFRSAGLPHSSTDVRAYGRYIDASNSYYANKRFSGDVDIWSDVAGTESIRRSSASADTDVTATTPRRLSFELIENMYRAKSWLESGTEPAWQFVGLLDPSVYWHEQGGAGMRSLNYNFDMHVTHVAVTELVWA